MNTNTRYFAIMPAAGNGYRMANEMPKQYLPLNGKPIIRYTLDALLNYDRFEKIIVPLAFEDQYWSTLNLHNHPKINTVAGGKERCYSVLNALKALQNIASDEDWVLVHDAVRPFLQASDLDKLISTLIDHPVGGLLGVPVRDTIKRTIEDDQVIATIDRTQLWCAYSPQMFRYKVLCDALQNAIDNELLVTDEASAIEFLGKTPLMIKGRHDNIKITFPEDITYVEWLFKQYDTID